MTQTPDILNIKMTPAGANVVLNLLADCKIGTGYAPLFEDINAQAQQETKRIEAAKQDQASGNDGGDKQE